MADALYGIKLVRVAALGGSPSWEVISTPQQANLTYQLQAGQRVEIRGGDKLYSAVEDDDELLGVDIAFTDAAMNGEAWAIIDGGSWDPTDKEYIPRAIGEENPGFQCEIYQVRYSEGSQHQGSIAGYTKFVFPFCKGAVSSFAQQDRQFTTPQFTIKARDTTAARCYSWENVATLPV